MPNNVGYHPTEITKAVLRDARCVFSTAGNPGSERGDTAGHADQRETDGNHPATLPTPDNGDENGESGGALGVAIAVRPLVLLAAVLGGTNDDRTPTLGPGRPR